MPTSPRLRILLYQDLPGRWLARSLEHDVTIEDATMEEASERVLAILVAHMEFDLRHGRPPLSTFPAAPRQYWVAFDRATPLRTIVCGSRAKGTERCVLVAFTTERPMTPAHRTTFVDPILPISPMGPRQIGPFAIH